jgi:hypothetical protein
MYVVNIKTESRIYDLFSRIQSAIQQRGRGILRMIPYTGCRTIRSVGVDSVAYPGFGKRLPSGTTHKLDGSQCTLWYKAVHKATDEQIEKAKYAVDVLKVSRQRYTGNLVDVFTHKGTLYVLLAGVLERDREDNKHKVNFRLFNLDDGTVYAAYIQEKVQAQAVKAAAPKAVKKNKKQVHNP